MSDREWVVVAGAAGDIGQAICAMFRADSYSVVGVDIRREGDDVDEWIECDLAEASDQDIAAQRSLLSGRLVRHTVVVTGGASVAELRIGKDKVAPLSVIRRTIELNLVAPFVILAVSLDALRNTPGSCSFTVVSSINALGGYGAPAYSAAKAGLAGFVASYAESLGEAGIRVNGVALGTTATRNFVRLNQEVGRETDFGALGSVIPLGQVLSPSQAARNIWVMAVQCTGVTGQVLVCDGGQHLRRPRARLMDNGPGAGPSSQS